MFQKYESRGLTVVLADITQLGNLFHVFTTLLVNPNFSRSYFACRGL